LNGKIIGIIGGVIAVVVVVFFLFNGVSTEIEQRKALEKVQTSVSSVTVNDIGFSGISLHLVLDMYNPNDITATLDRADFDIWINEKFVGNGSIEDRVNIPSYTTRQATTNFDANFYGSLKSGISAILEKEIRLKVSGTAYYDTLLGTLEIPFTFTRNYASQNNNYESNDNYESSSNNYSPPVDSDGDGLLDSVDNCPYDGYQVGSDGCPVTSSSKLPTQFISSLGEYTFFELNGEEFCYFIQLVDSKGNPIGSVPINFISGGLDSDKRVEYSSTDLEVVNNGGFFVAHHKSEKYICFIPGGQTNTGGFIQFEFMGNDEYLPSKSIMYQLWQ
jgi:hypothetical protein